MSGIVSTLLTLVLPSTLLVVLCGFGSLLLLVGHGQGALRSFGTGILGIGVAAFIVILALPVDQWVLRPLEDRFQPSQSLQHVDGIVLLGGAISASVSADRDLPVLNRDADRVVAFARLALAHPNARLLFAGGSRSNSSNQLTEAAATKLLLEGLGISPERLIIDDSSRTTWENARNASSLAKPRSDEKWILVTSASHMPRAIGAFKGNGWPSMLPWPVAYRSTQSGWPAFVQPIAAKLSNLDLAAHEWVGLLAYRIQGRTDQLLPE